MINNKTPGPEDILGREGRSVVLLTINLNMIP